MTASQRPTSRAAEAGWARCTAWPPPGTSEATPSGHRRARRTAASAKRVSSTAGQGQERDLRGRAGRPTVAPGCRRRQPKARGQSSGSIAQSLGEIGVARGREPDEHRSPQPLARRSRPRRPTPRDSRRRLRRTSAGPGAPRILDSRRPPDEDAATEGQIAPGSPRGAPPGPRGSSRADHSASRRRAPSARPRPPAPRWRAGPPARQPTRPWPGQIHRHQRGPQPRRSPKGPRAAPSGVNPCNMTRGGPAPRTSTWSATAGERSGAPAGDLRRHAGRTSGSECGLTDAVLCPGIALDPAGSGAGRATPGARAPRRAQCRLLRAGSGPGHRAPDRRVRHQWHAVAELHPAWSRRATPGSRCSCAPPTGRRSFTTRAPPRPSTRSACSRRSCDGPRRRVCRSRVKRPRGGPWLSAPSSEALESPSGPGPVHLNLAFREPLTADPGFLPERPGPRRHPGAPAVAELGNPLAGSGVVVVGGPMPRPPSRARVLALAEYLGWPVFASPGSGCRVEGTIAAADAIVRAGRRYPRRWCCSGSRGSRVPWPATCRRRQAAGRA